MPNLNRVLLIGNLTRDPEMQYTAKGTAITNISLAINRVTKTDDGEKREEVTYVDVTLWGNLAENAAKYLNKGKPVYIDGRLQLDQWDDKQTGQKRSKLKVVAESMQFLGSRDDNGGSAPAARPVAASRPTSGTVHKPQHHPELNPEPDDIPF